MEKNSTESPCAWDTSLLALIRWNWEKTAWAVVIAIALVARLYGLSWRAMSHDESLHSLYSWQLYDGRGYEHNPMMHGPYLFHLNALFYFLFGVNDATARVAVALTGTGMVALLWYLRPWLGQVGALAAAVMMTISPSLLYYSRYIRHDVLLAMWELVLVIAVFRYLQDRREHWLYLAAVALSLAYATMEASFINTVILVGFLLVYLLFLFWRERWDRPRHRLPFFASFVLGSGAAIVALYSVIEAEPGQPSPLAFLFVAGMILLLWAIYLLFTGLGQHIKTYPEMDVLIWLVSLSLPLFSAFLIKLMGWDPLDYSSAGIVRSGSVLLVMSAAAIAIGWGWAGQRWLVGAGLFYAIFLTLFTTFFTNGKGFATGIIGSLGYWMAQQEVQRGGQPWYYYLLLGPMYEFLPLLLSLGGIITFVAVNLSPVTRGLRPLRARVPAKVALHRQPISQRETAPGRLPINPEPAARADPNEKEGATVRAPLVLYLIWWTLFAWGMFSWAGEKMPWLTLHLAFPMTLLGGWFANWLWERVDRQALRERAWWKLAIVLPLLAFTLGPLSDFLRRLVAGQAFRDTTINGLSATTQGMAALVMSVALIYLGWGYAERLGARHSLSVVAGLLILGLTMWTVRVTWMLNYINYDLVNEMLVYAHGTPDIKFVMNEIEMISRRTVGDKQIKLAYDDDSTWPLEWYLREYPNKVFYGANPSREALDAPVVIVGDKNESKARPFLGNKYLRYKYRLVWWPREDYKGLTWERLWNGIRDPEKRRKFWDVLLYRKWDTPLNQWPYVHNFYLYVRRDIAAQVWNFGAGPVETPAVVDPYEKGYREVAAIRQIGVTGLPGMAPGQFQTPRGVAIAPDGRIVVADSGNHRIQVFDAQGDFLTAWGSSCDLYAEGRPGCVDPDGNGPLQLGDGQFHEPWGVAADAQGNIYVADTWNHRIQKFSPDGRFLKKWGFFITTGGQLGEPIGMWGPRAIVVDEQGNLYVTDTGNKRVQKFDPEGNFLGQWGGGGVVEGRMDEPVGLAIDAQGNFYVADTWNRRIQKFDANFAFIKEWPIAGWESQSIVNKPYLAIDREAGLVYATDPEGYRVLVFDTEGNFRAAFGQYGSDEKSFGLPNGVAVDAQGHVYVADADNHRIMVFPRVQ
ncbi:MAG: TIGR03663 family protein [Anaerolineae bacterium]|nr:TIGR03663 family protein [Anaerolineae bacterium]